MLKILAVTVSLKMKQPNPFDYEHYEDDLKAGIKAQSQFEGIRAEQLMDLNEHLEDGWEVLHTSDVEDGRGWHTFYTLRKSDQAMMIDSALAAGSLADDETVMLTPEGFKALEKAR